MRAPGHDRIDFVVNHDDVEVHTIAVRTNRIESVDDTPFETSPELLTFIHQMKDRGYDTFELLYRDTEYEHSSTIHTLTLLCGKNHQNVLLSKIAKNTGATAGRLKAAANQATYGDVGVPYEKKSAPDLSNGVAFGQPKYIIDDRTGEVTVVEQKSGAESSAPPPTFNKTEFCGIRLYISEVTSTTKGLHTMADNLLESMLKDQENQKVMVLLATNDDGDARFICRISPAAINKYGIRADVIVRSAAQAIGGSGGGSVHKATGGANQPHLIELALSEGYKSLEMMLSKTSAVRPS